MNENEIGKRIKEVRTYKNMTQKQLAEISKIDATSISRYENGTQIPNLNTLICIAVALEISLDYLVFGSKTDFKIIKKEYQNTEERIFESLAVLFEEKVIDCDEGYDEIYLELSEEYKAYKDFIIQYSKLKDLKGLIGEGFQNARTELIKSFAIKLQEEIRNESDLPF